MRLFIKQIRSLASADALFHLFAICFTILCMSQGYLGKDFGKPACFGSANLMVTACLTSSLFELHLSLTFLCQALHAPRLVRCLERSLKYSWIVGLMLGAGQTYICPFEYDIVSGDCQIRCRQLINFSVFGGTFLVASLAYTWSIIRMYSHAPQSVAAANWRRAMAYPLTVIFTYSSVVPGSFDGTEGPLTWTSTWVSFAGFVMLGLNGAINVFIYALQSRFAQRGRMQALLQPPSGRQMVESHSTVVSWRVDLGGGVEVFDVSFPSSSMCVQEGAVLSLQDISQRMCSGSALSGLEHNDPDDRMCPPDMPTGSAAEAPAGLERNDKDSSDKLGSDTYEVLQVLQDLSVYEFPNVSSKVISDMRCGAHVKIGRVILQDELFWGRTAEPAGWIVLRTTWDNCSYAAKVRPNSD